MTERDVDGLQQMKLIHKKKLTKLLKFLSENPPKPEVSKHRPRSVAQVCNTDDRHAFAGPYRGRVRRRTPPLGDPSGTPGCAAPNLGMTEG